MNLLAFACLATSFTPNQQLWVPMIRFTGDRGTYKNFETIRQEVKKLPSLLPKEPRILSDGSMALTDGTTVLAIFDPTYRPIKILLAKWQIIELILKEGPYVTFRFKDLPTPLYDLVYEWLARMSAAYDDELRVHFISEMSTQIDGEDNKVRFNIKQQPITMPDAVNSKIEESLHAHGLKDATVKREKKMDPIAFEPEVKVFVEDRASYGSQVAAERKALELFSHWLIKEHINLDNKLINNLELKQQLNPLGTILRSKTLSDYSQMSPKGFEEAMSYLQKRGSAAGYQDTDSLRSTLGLATMGSSGSFFVRLSNSQKRIVSDPTVAGTVGK
jgi:hypothetical protein